MSNWPLVTLESLFIINRGGSPRPIDDYFTADHDGVNWVLISDASDSSKYITKTRKRIRKAGVSRSRAVKPGDFVLSNSMSFGKPYIMATSGCVHDGWLVLTPRTDNINSDFFYHLLGSDLIYAEFTRRAAGATVKNLNIDLVKDVSVRLPPLAKQQRIAAILDQADALRTKRRHALTKLEALTHSVFTTIFEDAGGASNWPKIKFIEAFAAPLRNGLSPANAGAYAGRVLTLSAITGERFKPDARKLAQFAVRPPSNQMVCAGEFLICRGNGNLHLVGKGQCATMTLADTLFPDTIIAARLDNAILNPKFLQHIWNLPSTRKQIEAVARTTNGTYKVNQTMLENIEIFHPPLHLQHMFASQQALISAQISNGELALCQADALFASLQHQAFRGEL